MSIHIEWGTTDHTLLIWRVVGDLSLEEYHAAGKKTSAFMRTEPCRTVVIDFRKCHNTSQNLIPTIREQLHRLQSYQGEVIILSKTQFWQNLYHVVAQSTIGVRLPNIRFQITQDENGDILATL